MQGIRPSEQTKLTFRWRI